MSMCYWACEGIGINTRDVIDSLNVERCISLLKEQLPNEEFSEEEFDITDYFYGSPLDNFGELLCVCDDTDSMTYGDDGEGEYYFYYPRSYPWERSNNEPKTIEDVHERIIRAVQKICDLTAEQIDKIIDDNLCVIGCG